MKYFLALFFLFFGCLQSWSQDTLQDTVIQSKIFVENANNTIIDKSGVDVIRYFNGDVRMYKDSVFMFCDSARLINNDLIALGNVVFVQTDTIKIFCDSLLYNGNTEIARLFDEVTLENGEERLFTESLVYNAKLKEAVYQDTAIMQFEETQLQSILGTYKVNEKKAYFSKEVVLENNELRLRTDSLEYFTDLKKALFVSPTRIVEKKRKIYCEDGFYDFISKRALFTGNPQLIENDDLATADSIRYNGLDSLLTLNGRAVYEKPTQLAQAESIVYNISTEQTSLNGNASFLDLKTGNKTTGEVLEYLGQEYKVKILGDAYYENESAQLTSDELEFDEDKGDGFARGDVIYVDTSSNISILSDELFIRDKTNLKAIGLESRPYIINNIDNDSLYLAADTLFSEELIFQDSLKDSLDFLIQIDVDTAKRFWAFDEVRILKSDFTAICDSLSFNDQDSIFKLFKNPVVWSDSTQFAGDTIYIHLENEKISHIEVLKNGFIIEQLEEGIFNQIKGRRVEVWFKDDQIDHMNVTGSAETLYFFQDDTEAYIGVNRTLCSHMTFYFEEKELKDIKFFKDPDSVLTPIHRTSPKTERLDGFDWQYHLSPLTLSDLTSKN